MAASPILIGGEFFREIRERSCCYIDKTNFLEFMTDGVSDFENDRNQFEELVRNWCSMAEAKNLYAFYVMLTPQARNDQIKRVNQCDRLKMVDPTDGPVVISLQELTPPEKISFNTHDDYGKPFTLKLSSSTSAVLKNGYKVRITSSENPYIHVDEVCEVSPADMSISFTPEQMKELLPKQSTLFVVGAGHLPGEKGMINLLREAGYKVKPVKKH